MYVMFWDVFKQPCQGPCLQAIVVHSDSPSVSDAHTEKPHSSLLITLGLEGLCDGKADVSVRQ